MHKIITFAVIVFVIICAVALAKGTTLSAFVSDAIGFIKRLFRQPQPVHNSEANKLSPRTTGLSERTRKDKSGVFLTGSQAKCGIQTQITVSDRSGGVIGSKTLYIDDSPLLIGRGADIAECKVKLCLPDISESPTTSRTHCTLTNVSGKLTLKDCYDRSSAFNSDGNQIHSVSNDRRTNNYIGYGFVIDSGKQAEIDIGDYILEVKNLTGSPPRSVPTYGYEKIPSVPTKEYKIR